MRSYSAFLRIFGTETLELNYSKKYAMSHLHQGSSFNHWSIRSLICMNEIV